MNVKYQIESFGKSTSIPAEDLAKLHAELLPGSPISELGSRFMKRFYYAELPRKGYIFGAVGYVDDYPAGFVVATHDSNGFMKAALCQLWWKLAWEIGMTILFCPQHIRSVWEAFSIMRSRKTGERDQSEGEILSFGVLPNYLDPRFIRKTGLHIAHDLFQHVINQLQTRDVPLIRAIVDSDNISAQLFYHGLGWMLERGEVSGWKVPVVEFVWRPSIEGEK